MDCAMDFAYFSRDQHQKSEMNIIEIDLSCLKQGSNLATGEPIYCSGCRSLLSSYSHLIRTEPKTTWPCEFCGIVNDLNLDDEEIPNAPELTYVLESAAQVAKLSEGNSERSTIIFCIDISGSMCVSKPVSGKLHLKTDKQTELMKLIMPGEEDQYWPGSNRNITYVSRLQCVQAAIESQIHDFMTISPDKKIGLIAFNGEIRIIGDGTVDEIITGDKLNNYQALKDYASQKAGTYVTRKISETGRLLKDKILSLEESGPTALGPALLMSILTAGEGGPGSKVIICTDGLANVGLGSLDIPENRDFYINLGALAAEKGVSVSIISIEGDECKLEALMSVTEASGGDILRVAPENVSEEFANILSNDVIATHVNVEVTLYKAVQFKNEDSSSLSFGKSRLQKKVGNATSASSFSFAYNLKSDEELDALMIDKQSLQFIPMQTVFTYKSLEGMKCIRVINRRQPITFNKQEAKKNAKVDLLARAGRRQAAKFAEQGRYEDMRTCALEWKNEISQQDLKNTSNLKKAQEFHADLDDLQQEVLEQECLEMKMGYKCEEDNEDVVGSFQVMEMSNEVKREMPQEERKAPKPERREVFQDKFISKVNKMQKKK